MNRVAPMVAGASAVSAVPGVAATAPGAVAAAAQRIGSAMATSSAWQRFGPTIAIATGTAAPNTNAEKWLRRGVEALEGGAIPIPPHGGSLYGQLGGTAIEIGKRAWQIYEQQRLRQGLNKK